MTTIHVATDSNMNASLQILGEGAERLVLDATAEQIEAALLAHPAGILVWRHNGFTY